MAASPSACARPRNSSSRKRAPPIACWAGPESIVTVIAVAMSLFHLYAAYEIVPTQELRYTHVAFVLLLAFLVFPAAARFRDQHPLVGRDCRPDLRRHPDLRDRWRRGVHRPRDDSQPHRRDSRCHLHRPADRGDAPHHRSDRTGHRASVHRLCVGRPLAARRHGITAATDWTRWSGICSSRWKASSASRSTYPQP